MSPTQKSTYLWIRKHALSLILSLLTLGLGIWTWVSIHALLSLVQ